MLPVEWTEKREPGVVVPIPTFPLPSIVNLAFVPTAVEEAILNLLMSAVSTPIAQPELVELVLKFKDGVVLPAIVKRLSGVAVPMPTFPVERIVMRVLAAPPVAVINSKSPAFSLVPSTFALILAISVLPVPA